MATKILLINPNSNDAVTEGMREAVAPLSIPHGPVMECMTLHTGPFGVETQRDVDSVAVPLADVVHARPDAEVYVIACYSDPGLAVCREATQKPVLGIRECSIFSALSVADRFGLIALSQGSVRRHSRAFREMGVSTRCAGFAPLGMSVAKAEEPGAFPHIEAAGQRLLESGADAVVLGCAGMARHRAPLEERLGVPVVDPVQAAAAQALGLALLRAA
ncbi:MAG: aspartate/glutamate racemase family protein [Pseudomonadota bacterium]